MKKNMGDLDKGLRLLLAGILAILYFIGIIKGVLGIVVLVIAIVFAVTSFVGFCPLYTLFGFSTCTIKKPHQPPHKKHKK
ncbi:MAG: DUF2892 domain-containing protein [Chitinophagaceae bacterium]|jgi:hypothetical protein|nr:DUF2892 domain-containing protein [Chitinophagaceae bacterium]